MLRPVLFVHILLCLIAVSACSSSSDDDDGNDSDRDLIADNIDNCPSTYNPDQAATIADKTQLGDACDDEDADGVHGKSYGNMTQPVTEVQPSTSHLQAGNQS